MSGRARGEQGVAAVLVVVLAVALLVTSNASKFCRSVNGNVAHGLDSNDDKSAQ